MNVLLINPWYPISETPSPPLGLAYLAASLERAGHRVNILDYVVYPYSIDGLKRQIERFSPDWVGVTAVTMNVNKALQIVRDVKSIDPHIGTVMGGPHVTFAAEDTLAACPGLDVAAIGEGEHTLIRLVESPAQRDAWLQIPGIVYRDGERFIRTAPKAGFLDVKLLPDPARHLLALARYRILHMPITLTTSRGCPFQCIFCVGRKMVGAKVRYREPEKVADEIESIAGLGFHQINIADDLFTANEKHCLAICDEIRRRGLQVPWTSFARVDTVSLKVLENMKAAGCTAVSFGMESANAAILKTCRKGITRQQILDAVQMCAQAGIQAHGSFILGLPGESAETISETLAFGERLKEMGVSFGFHLLAPFPGTRVREEREAYGIRILSDNWDDYHANRAIVETNQADRQMMNAIVERWEDAFNAELGRISERMRSGAATPEESGLVTNLERTVWIYEMMMAEALETIGALPAEPPDAAIRTLAGKAISFVKHATPDRLVFALQTARDRGDLVDVSTGNEMHWRWREKL
ncbi:B12-binding domain-containing radical SAM protein [Desulfatirhabdium butyrativorans]|uniref:B12-binding domain-containing radical SAM protein n=1 Tax=Desulfatirhabdium butyrativorans TaxID=340467 RepID=UPI00068402C5|nr:radical SAM protein [Desulfatirhabdium butyrativorans]